MPTPEGHSLAEGEERDLEHVDAPPAIPGHEGRTPNPDGACLALARHPRALSPVPGEIVCTEQRDGPEVALVRGTFRGKRIRATFNRTDGCEIRRWNALAALLPRG